MNQKDHVSFTPADQGSHLDPSNAADLESKKDEFHKYLEEKQLMKTLNNLLVQFYESVDARDHPTEFIQHYFSVLGGVDIEDVKKENEKLMQQVEEKKAKLAELQANLAAQPVQ